MFYNRTSNHLINRFGLENQMGINFDFFITNYLNYFYHKFPEKFKNL